MPSKGSKLAYIGLGANLDDPVQKIFDAVQKLKVGGVARLSSLYLTSPVGYEHQSDFVNAVLELKTTLSANQLLAECQAVEQQMGRERDANNQNAARVIDCDILLYANEVIQTEQLTVPHPRLEQRLFVLEPLNELDADLEVPGKGKIKKLLAECDRTDQSIIKLN